MNVKCKYIRFISSNVPLPHNLEWPGPASRPFPLPLRLAAKGKQMRPALLQKLESTLWEKATMLSALAFGANDAGSEDHYQIPTASFFLAHNGDDQDK